MQSHPVTRAFFPLLDRGGEGHSAWIASASLRRRRSPNVWTSQSCLLSSTWFFECVHLFINKPKMVITEPAVPSARLLGLTAKLYPSNIVACSFPSTPNSRKRMEGLANRVMQSAFLHAVVWFLSNSASGTAREGKLTLFLFPRYDILNLFKQSVSQQVELWELSQVSIVHVWYAQHSKLYFCNYLNVLSIFSETNKILVPSFHELWDP